MLEMLGVAGIGVGVTNVILLRRLHRLADHSHRVTHNHLETLPLRTRETLYVPSPRPKPPQFIAINDNDHKHRLQ